MAPAQAENGGGPGLPSFKRLLSFEFGALSLDDGEPGEQQEEQQQRQEEHRQEAQSAAEHGYDVLVRPALAQVAWIAVPTSAST